MTRGSSPSGNEGDVDALFVLISGHSPDGYVFAQYNVLNGSVSVQYEKDLMANCAAVSSIAIEDLRFYTISRTIGFEVTNIGADNVTLSNAVISAASTNVGYRGSISIDLRSIHLTPGESAQITSPQLSNLTVGDHIEVKVTTSVGTFATAPGTDSLGS